MERIEPKNDEESSVGASAELVIVPAGTVVPARESAPLPEHLLAGVKENQALAFAASTARSYASDWASFERWCDAHGQFRCPHRARPSRPTSPTHHRHGLPTSRGTRNLRSARLVNPTSSSWPARPGATSPPTGQREQPVVVTFGLPNPYPSRLFGRSARLIQVPGQDGRYERQSRVRLGPFQPRTAKHN